VSFLKNIRINTFGWIFVALLVLSAGGLSTLSFQAKNNVDTISQTWTVFQASRSEKSRLLSTLRGEIGFGGMIHQFKNFILRMDPPRLAKIRKKLAGAVGATIQYQALGVSEAEKKSLADISAMLTAYSEATILAEAMSGAGGETPESLDKMVKISDGPALKGLEQLEMEANNERGKYKDAQTKTVLLSDMRAAIGYGGMIHQFKNFVLRKDNPRIAKVVAKHQEALSYIEAYKKFKLSDAEKTALENIVSVLNAYRSNVDMIVKMAAAGKNSKEIDKAVKISDGPAVKGLNTLMFEIVREGNILAEDVDQRLASIEELMLSSEIINISVGVVLVLISLFLIRGRIVGPIDNITKVMNRLAGGEQGVEIAGTENGDEIGEMARALEVFKNNLEQTEQMRLDQEQAEVRQREEQRHKLLDLANQLESEVGSVSELVLENAGQIVSQSGRMGTKIDVSSSRSLEVAETSEETTHDAENVATAAEQLSASVSEISRQVSQSTQVSDQAVEEAKQADETVRGLEDAAHQIGDVVNLINDIAEQTNLLALNATIEAARAGDAGKGFAVVASEVKNLANQTAKATDEIQGQITTIQSEIGNAVSAIQRIMTTIGNISEVSASIASAVEQQGGATSNIAENIRRVTEQAQNVLDKVADMTRASATSYSGAISVMWAADDLTSPAESLNHSVKSFLTDLRSGG